MADTAWIERQPLEAMLARLTALVEADRRALSGDTAARLVRRLIAHETAPGGPYRDDSGIVSPIVNARVVALMRSLGQSLPAVEAYLETVGHRPAARRRNRVTLKARHLSATQQATQSMVMAGHGPLRPHARAVFNAVLSVDCSGEISELAANFADSLTARVPVARETLGVANLLTWMAYSIYDDFIDEEGTPSLLPVANIAHRQALELYRQAAGLGRPVDIDAVFAGMDEANAWELGHARYAVSDDTITVAVPPAYGSLTVLSQRARAHVLGPLIILKTSAPNPAANRLVAGALDDYLIARQLSDDLHDWVKDLARGHISPVVARLLRHADVASGNYALPELTRRLQRIFWDVELSRVSHVALRRIIRAERRLAQSGLFTHDNPFARRVLHPIRDSLTAGLDHWQQDRRFLDRLRIVAPRAPHRVQNDGRHDA